MRVHDDAGKAYKYMRALSKLQRQFLQETGMTEWKGEGIQKLYDEWYKAYRQEKSRQEYIKRKAEGRMPKSKPRTLMTQDELTRAREKGRLEQARRRGKELTKERIANERLKPGPAAKPRDIPDIQRVFYMPQAAKKTDDSVQVVKIPVRGQVPEHGSPDGCVWVSPQHEQAVREMNLFWNKFGYINVESPSDTHRVFKALHIFIVQDLEGQEIPEDCVVHHVDTRRYNNTMENLAITTRMHNSAARRNGTVSAKRGSQFKGVVWGKPRWDAQIHYKGQHYYLGRFDDELEAARTYDKAYIAFHLTTDGCNGVLQSAEEQDILKNPEAFRPAAIKKAKNIKPNGTGWQAFIQRDKVHYSKTFRTIDEAEEWRDAKLKELHNLKEQAHLQRPIERDENDVAVIRVKNKEACVFAKVDEDMWHTLAKHAWSLRPDGYAGSTVGMMHRMVIGASTIAAGKVVDHINRDPLDNRRENLRVVTPSMNARNTTKKADASSQMIGVCWVKKSNCWKAQIRIQGDHIHLGHFKTEKEAKEAYDKAVFELEGDVVER